MPLRAGVRIPVGSFNSFIGVPSWLPAWAPIISKAFFCGIFWCRNLIGACSRGLQSFRAFEVSQGFGLGRLCQATLGTWDSLKK